MNLRNIISFILRVIAAVIMLQTLYFKFSAAPESVYIFSQVGIEPWGRIATGVAEFIASILLFIPATIVIGALLAIGIMFGAIATHLFILGIEVQGDGGQLFIYGMIVLIASVVVVMIHSQQFTRYKARLLRQN